MSENVAYLVSFLAVYAVGLGITAGFQAAQGRERLGVWLAIIAFAFVFLLSEILAASVTR